MFDEYALTPLQSVQIRWLNVYLQSSSWFSSYNSTLKSFVGRQNLGLTQSYFR